ncbi:MAG: DUF1990 domain-containing protein [Actinobacteria bacterium]|nr:DUF1990 domain-containing protein [Actinomycetota bacterium]
MLTLRRPTDEDLLRVIERQRSEDLTYSQVGATVTGDLPAGYRHDRLQVDLLPSEESFVSAKAGLAEWAPQRRSGLAVVADGPVAVGTTVAVAAPLPVGWAIAACRVVAVIDEPTRSGFAYGTLPEHPEEGEELFVVDRELDGGVRFSIVAFSRPHDVWTRVGGPLARSLQARATRKYLHVMRDGG